MRKEKGLRRLILKYRVWGGKNGKMFKIYYAITFFFTSSFLTSELLCFIITRSLVEDGIHESLLGCKSKKNKMEIKQDYIENT